MAQGWKQVQRIAAACVCCCGYLSYLSFLLSLFHAETKIRGVLAHFCYPLSSPTDLVVSNSRLDVDVDRGEGFYFLSHPFIFSPLCEVFKDRPPVVLLAYRIQSPTVLVQIVVLLFHYLLPESTQ